MGDFSLPAHQYKVYTCTVCVLARERRGRWRQAGSAHTSPARAEAWGALEQVLDPVAIMVV